MRRGDTRVDLCAIWDHLKRHMIAAFRHAFTAPFAQVGHVNREDTAVAGLFLLLASFEAIISNYLYHRREVSFSIYNYLNSSGIQMPHS